MPFRIIRNDITKVRADAIVNTANPRPVYGRGSDRAIYRAAGEEQLLKERRKIGEIAVGEAAATKAFGLKAKYIIHTAGPIWQGGEKQELEKLAACYRKSLFLALQLGCESVAFPLISAGTYQFPKDIALKIALQEIKEFLSEEEMDVTLVVYDKTAYEISKELTDRVDSYIDEQTIESRRTEEEGAGPDRPLPAQTEARNDNRPPMYPESARYDTGTLPETEEYEEAYHRPSVPPQPAKTSAVGGYAAPAAAPGRKSRRLNELIRQQKESFQERLLRTIDEKGMTDVEVYKKANIDRKLFSKIRSNPAYQPKKRTALALAMALELNLDETIDLISRAGLALSPAFKADLIIRYCIENGIYDLYTVNSLLFDYDQPLLGE